MSDRIADGGRDSPFLLFGLALISLLIVVVAACGGEATPVPGPLDRRVATLTIASTAFSPGGPIPIEYTCDGQDTSPPLAWGPVPDGTESLALVMDDLDAPGDVFIHWVVYDMEADRRSIAAGVSDQDELDDGGVQGTNSFGRTGYDGPCPPRGDSAHTYRFFLYASDKKLELEPGASATQVVEAIRGHVLGVGQLEGTYSRP